MRAVLAAALAGLLAFAARPAAALDYDAKKLDPLCMGVSGQYVSEPKDGVHMDWVEKAVFEAVGAPPSRADDPAVKAKIAAMMRREASLPPGESHVYCDGAYSIGWRGTVLNLAMRTNDPEYQLERLTGFGLDINWADVRTGRTMLDNYRDIIERDTREEELGKRTRLEYERRTPVSEMRHYERFREMGARHAGERAASVDCGPTAADASTPGVPFDGQWSATGTGPTPQQIPGVKTISPRQLACMLNRPNNRVLLLAAIRDEVAIPGSQSVSWAAGGTGVSDATQAVFVDFMGVGKSYGDKRNRPVVVYCHHDQCRLSYNVLLRLKAAGFTDLYWLRAGLRAWREAGYPLGPNAPTLATKASTSRP